MEKCERKAFGEDIGILRAGGHMKNTYGPGSNLIANEVDVDLNVFGALVLHRVGGHVYGADVVTIDNGGLGRRAKKFVEKIAYPACFCNRISNSSIFCLCARAGDHPLSFGGP